MKRLAKLGVSLEAAAFIIQILERNRRAMLGATHATRPATVATPSLPSKSTERSRKWREKKKLAAVASGVASVAGGVALPVVFPTPLSSLPENPLTEGVLKKEEETVIAPAKKDPRGCRIPEDFVPDASCEKVARELNYTKAQWNRVLIGFIDYWRGIAGTRGRKIDWQATFRNELRNAPPNRRGNANGNGSTDHKSNSIAGRFDKIKSAIAERESELAGHEGGNGSGGDYIDHVP